MSPKSAPAPGSTPLPVGTRLRDYEITGVVGEGGFGIVYRAFDHALRRPLAVKEYMPAALANRGDDGSVTLRAEHLGSAFQAGMRSFINEARLLAAFDHPALLKVFTFWEQNGTAYLAMPLYEGRTLKALLREAPRPSEDWLKTLFAPLLDALEVLHRAECYHRDVAPDNIMVLADGAPVLLDFGAARRIISNMTQDVTVVLKPGFAPIEQYADDPSMKQGAWTDVYAVAAVLYYAITGKPPPTPVTRIVADPIKPLRNAVPGYSDTFLAGIDRGLAVRPENRPQSIAEFRTALGLVPGADTAAATTTLAAGAMPAEAEGSAPPPEPPAMAAAEAPLPRTSAAAPSVAASVASSATPSATRSAAPTATSSAAPSAAPAEAPFAASNSAPMAKAPAAVTGLPDLDLTARMPGSILEGLDTAAGRPRADATDSSRRGPGSSAGASVATTPGTAGAGPAPAPLTGRRWIVPAVVAATLAGVAVLLWLRSPPPPDGPATAPSVASTTTAQMPATSSPPPSPAPSPPSPAPSPSSPEASPPSPVPSPPSSSSETSPAAPAPLPTAAGAAPPQPSPPVDAGATQAPPVAPASADARPAPVVAGAPPPVAAGGSGAASPGAQEAAPKAPPPKTGKVRFAVKPWGEVLIDGKSRGPAPPLVDLVLAEGSHRIEIRNGTFPPFETVVDVRAGRTTTVTHAFAAR